MNLPGLSPYILTIGPLQIHWYAVFIVCTVVIGYSYLYSQKERLGLTEDLLTNAILWAVVGGVVGARVVFVIFNQPGWIINDPMQILRIYDGGLAFHGAVGGGLLAAWLYLRHKSVSFGRFMDNLIPGLATGVMLVRIGNIFNHEVLGHFSIYAPGGEWPAQLIGGAIGVVLMLHYFWYAKRNPPPGAQFWSALFYYSLLRGFIGETIRANPTLLVHYLNPVWGIGFITVEQFFTPLLLVGTYYFWWRAVRQGGAHPVATGQIQA